MGIIDAMKRAYLMDDLTDEEFEAEMARREATEIKKDEKGNEVACYVNGKLEWEEPFIYNDRGELIEHTRTDANGNVLFKRENKYEYDADGRWVKRTLFEDGKVLTQNYYNYDQFGNVVEEIVCNDTSVQLYSCIAFYCEDNTYWFGKCGHNQFYNYVGGLSNLYEKGRLYIECK